MSVSEFYRRALYSLGDNCRAARPARIPEETPQCHLAEISLAAFFPMKLLGVEADTIETSLRGKSIDRLFPEPELSNDLY